MPAVEADRFAPVAILETANTTPNSTGARKLAVAGRTVYAQMTRMGGSGWGEMISVRWPGEPKTDEGKAPRTESPIKLNIEEFKSALGAARFYGSNQRASYLCNSPDGRRVFFATRYEDEAHKVRFYLGDDTGRGSSAGPTADRRSGVVKGSGKTARRHISAIRRRHSISPGKSLITIPSSHPIG